MGISARKKALFGAGILGAGLVGGGLFAATLANVSAPGFAAGQATLSATCANPETADVRVDSTLEYVNGDWTVPMVGLVISDTTNPVTCDGVNAKLTAVDASGNALQTVSFNVAQEGAGVDMYVTFNPSVLAGDVAGYAVALEG